MRDDTQDANLSGWIGDCGHDTLSASATSTASTTATAGHLPGRNDGPGWHDVPHPAAAAAPTASQGWRTRLIFRGAGV